jgi:ribosomal protein S18 acetylase RimI-like enzyme
MGPTDKLFLVTRADLPPGVQAVQAAHALREFAHHHPEIDREWYTRSNYLAFLAVPNEEALDRLLCRVRERGFSAAPFTEPDRGHELTAIAIEPAARRLVSGLPLALRCIEAA